MTTPESLARALQPALDAALTDLMARIVFSAEGRIKMRTPVRTGLLRRSITGQVQEVGRRGVVGTNVLYARPVNNRQRFFEQGIADATPEIQRLLVEAGQAWAEGAST